MKVGALTSTKTQVPYDYYYAPFCPPRDLVYKPANLGVTLSGESLASSPYRIDARVAEDCKLVCKKTLGKNDVRRASARDLQPPFLEDRIEMKSPPLGAAPPFRPRFGGSVLSWEWESWPENSVEGPQATAANCRISAETPRNESLTRTHVLLPV